MRYLYTAILTPKEDGKGYYCRVPDIPHCITTGKDLADAVAMITDAATLMLLSYVDEKTPVPKAALPQAVEVPEGSLSSLLLLDTDQYRMETDTRAVRKSVSLPAWMARRAEARGVNCSQLLQDALRKQFDNR